MGFDNGLYGKNQAEHSIWGGEKELLYTMPPEHALMSLYMANVMSSQCAFPFFPSSAECLRREHGCSLLVLVLA